MGVESVLPGLELGSAPSGYSTLLQLIFPQSSPDYKNLSFCTDKVTDGSSPHRHESKISD